MVVQKFEKVGLIFTVFLLTDVSVSQAAGGVETRLGWEVQRQSIVGILGYSIPTSETWSLLPELNFVAAFTPSLSARWSVPLSPNVSASIQGGLGLSFPPSPPSLAGLLAVSLRLKTKEDCFCSLEGRVIAPGLDTSQNIEVGGSLSSSKVRSLRYYPPIVVSIGFEF